MSSYIHNHNQELAQTAPFQIVSQLHMHDSSCCYLPIVISSYQDAMLRSPFEVPESTTSSPNRYGKCSTVTLNTCIDSGSQMNGMTYKTSRYLLLFYLILSPSFTMSHTCTLSASDPKVFNDAAMDCSTDRFKSLFSLANVYMTSDSTVQDQSGCGNIIFILHSSHCHLLKYRCLDINEY